MEHISIRILITVLIKRTRVEGFKRVSASSSSLRRECYAAQLQRRLILFRFHAAFFSLASCFTQPLRKIHYSLDE